MPEEKSILDKAKDLATDIKDKVTGLVGENEEKIDSAIDKTGEFVDDKTKHKYTEKIDRAQEAAKSAVSKVAGSTDKPTATDEATEPEADKPAEPKAEAEADKPATDEADA
jgi:hypothetical protein